MRDGAYCYWWIRLHNKLLERLSCLITWLCKSYHVPKNCSVGFEEDPDGRPIKKTIITERDFPIGAGSPTDCDSRKPATLTSMLSHENRFSCCALSLSLSLSFSLSLSLTLSVFLSSFFFTHQVPHQHALGRFAPIFPGPWCLALNSFWVVFVSTNVGRVCLIVCGLRSIGRPEPSSHR